MEEIEKTPEETRESYKGCWPVLVGTIIFWLFVAVVVYFCKH